MALCQLEARGQELNLYLSLGVMGPQSNLNHYPLFSWVCSRRKLEWEDGLSLELWHSAMGFKSSLLC